VEDPAEEERVEGSPGENTKGAGDCWICERDRPFTVRKPGEVEVKLEEPKPGEAVMPGEGGDSAKL